MTSRENASERRHRARSPWGVLGTTLGLVAIILALVLNSCSFTSIPVATCTPVPGPTGAIGAEGVAGASAYDVWVALGNSGTEEEFLQSLVGEKGDDGYTGSDGIDAAVGAEGDHGHSAYQLWLDAGNSGSEQDFLESLVGAAGADGIQGVTGENGTDGLSAFELWKLEGHPDGTIAEFWADLEGEVGEPGIQGLQGIQGIQGIPGPPGECTPGDAGATGPQGEQGPIGLTGPPGPQGDPGEQGIQGEQGPKGEPGATGPAGPLGLGDSGSFWDVTRQGYDGLVSRSIQTVHPIYFSEADTTNNVGITIERCAGDESKPAGYPVTPKSCITFTHAGVYNIAFSAQLWRTQGGDSSLVSIWLRKDGVDVPQTNTDITMQSNSQKLVAAWNFFAPVTCDVDGCDRYQLVWSASNQYSNIWYQGAQNSPTRPEIPSVILTVNQVK